MSSNYPIDFVVTWVDGNDPEWRLEKSKYLKQYGNDDAEQRYRDWDQLRYWFRGIEKFAPWVNKIYFITCGHLPKWLNTDNPKLVIVKHEDYIPHEFLPVFSSIPIELCLNRIAGLSEHFVYFNDDFFVLNKLSPKMFFHKGIPCATVGFDLPGKTNSVFNGILYQDNQLINRNFNCKIVWKKCWKYFFNIKYGIKQNMKNLCLSLWVRWYFPDFYNAHNPNAFLKSTFDEVWSCEQEKLTETCRSRFRSFEDVNQYIFLWWQWCKGKVFPNDVRKISKYISIDSDMEFVTDFIKNAKIPIMVLNDDRTINDFEIRKKRINASFEEKFPEKSSFEL